MFFRLLIPLYQLLIITVPIGMTAIPYLWTGSWWWRGIYSFLVPLVYGVSYVLVCGSLSLPFRSGIREGKFDRSLSDPVYRIRRLHALCWTSIYYSPGYSHFLAFPWLRAVLFRLFGYRGSLDFTCYSDTWIRDLPILQIGSGAYLSNKATIGTNLALKDGRILVEGIQIGSGAMVGHLTMVAAGSCFGDGAEISHGTASGARVSLGNSVVVKPHCSIDHCAEIGNGAEVGSRSYVGLGAVIGPGVKVPEGSVIPRRTRIRTQSEMDHMRALETIELMELRKRLAESLRSPGDGCQPT